MKKIQWYPGHMAKAMQEMRESLKLVDGIVFVLDARCPASSFNAKLKALSGAKPILYVLNKCDMADGKVDILLSAMRDMGAKAVKLNAVNANSRRDIMGAIQQLTEEKRRKALEKGQNKTFRFMVSGVPNTGKSTIINLLAGSKRTVTGNKAGVTRSRQWIRLGDIELLDTPGVMPPDCENQTYAARLACVGGINDDILDMNELSLTLLGELYAKYPARLSERYGIESPDNMLETICQKRGFLLKGGDCDIERCARAVIDDFRKGRLGKITLDTAADVQSTAF